MENMPEFIAATEAVLTETACEDDSSQICIARVISGRRRDFVCSALR